MGTWGVHSFENDTAVEWAAAYREMGLGVAGSTIRIALEDAGSKGLDADMACRGIAAVEAVAHAIGRGSAEAAQHFDGAPAADASDADALVSDADKLIMAITGASELAVLWKEASWDDNEKWLASLTELRARLSGQTDAAQDDADPVSAATAAGPSSDAMLEDLRKAIGGLEYDIQVLRQEMNENFARLAKRVEGIGR